MSDHSVAAFDLAALDIDGAIRETEDAVQGDSRADFFRKAAIGGSALVGSGAILGALPQLAAAKPSPKQDVKILNYALTLEYLEAAFYKEALKRNILTGDVATVTKVVSKHENTHVKFLKTALGSAANKSPKFDFGAATDNQANFLKTAVTLEDTGVKAYSGQATNIFSSKIVKAAVSILVVEARHASRFRALNGQNFAPGAFGAAASRAQVLKAVNETKFIKK